MAGRLLTTMFQYAPLTRQAAAKRDGTTWRKTASCGRRMGLVRPHAGRRSRLLCLVDARRISILSGRALTRAVWRCS